MLASEDCAEFHLLPSETTRNQYTTNRTFRLLKSAADVLEQVSRDRSLSENAIINELIMKNLRVETVERQLKPVSLPAMTFRALFEKLPAEKVIEVAKNDANDGLIRNVFIEADGVLSPKSILRAMKTHHDVSETHYDGKMKVVLAHYAGRNYSLLVGTMYQTLFALAGLKVEFSIDEDGVLFDLGSLK